MNENDREICWKTGKVCFTQREAGFTIRSFKNHKTKKNKQMPVRYYYCKYCHYFHLTHYRHSKPTHRFY